jgi:hypothetical protein
MKAILRRRRSGLKPIKYTLQIHYPGRIDVPVAKYESSSPFAAISQGEYLHPLPTPDETSAWSELGPQQYLEVTEVHHGLYEPMDAELITHTVELYTKLQEV